MEFAGQIDRRQRQRSRMDIHAPRTSRTARCSCTWVVSDRLYINTQTHSKTMQNKLTNTFPSVHSHTPILVSFLRIAGYRTHVEGRRSEVLRIKHQPKATPTDLHLSHPQHHRKLSNPSKIAKCNKYLHSDSYWVGQVLSGELCALFDAVILWWG